MSTPVVENIATALKTQLETITTANGYTQTVTVVRPPRLQWEPYAHNMIIVQQDTPEQLVDLEGDSTMWRWRQPFMLTLIVRPSDTRTTAVSTTINKLWCDVIKCLQNADTWWQAVSGVEDVRTGAPVWMTLGDGSYDGAEVILEADYRVDRGDPYTAR